MRTSTLVNQIASEGNPFAALVECLWDRDLMEGEQIAKELAKALEALIFEAHSDIEVDPSVEFKRLINLKD